MMEPGSGSIIAAAAEGILSGRVARLSIQDARTSLAFKVHIPVIVRGTEATLSVDLRHPQVRSWRGLSGREYRFDESTRRYEKSDGETYARDDVFGDVRTASAFYDTFISRVAFGHPSGEHMNATIEGTIRMAEDLVPFAVSGQVRVGGVVVEKGMADEAARQLDQDAYQPAVVRGGFLTYDPRF